MGEYKEVLLVVLGFAAKEVWDWIKAKLNREAEEERGERKELTKAVNDLSHKVTELNATITHMAKLTEMIPKIVRDIDQAHMKIRAMELINES